MADWKKELRPASFRGVPFYVDSSQYTGGRRVALHEFPDRDNAYPEDLGQVGKTWKVEGYVLGEDYLEKKQAIMDAADKFGPGELVHPYYGTLSVQCGPLGIDEVKGEGGYAKLSFQFYKAGEPTFPQAVDNKKALLRDVASIAQDAAKGDFDSVFDVAKLPGFAVDTARAGVANAALMYEQATRGVVTTIEGIANLAYSIRNLRAEVNDLVQAPGKLSTWLLDSLDLLVDAVEGGKDQFKALSSGFGFGNGDTPVRGETPTRTRERDNQNSFNDFVQRIFIAQAAATAIDVPYDSMQEASRTRNQLRDLIEDVVLNTDNDEVFTAFKDLGAQLVSALPDTSASLPSLRTIEVKDTVPSLVLAYDLFENAELEADIVKRNSISNPVFIVGGTELEVLDVV